jgi:hypothetical protein
MPSVCGHIVNNLCVNSRTICAGSSTVSYLQSMAAVETAYNQAVVHSLSTIRITGSSTSSSRQSVSVGMQVIPTFHSTYNHHHIF